MDSVYLPPLAAGSVKVHMSALKIPYPPGPDHVPEGLTDYADSYTKQQNLLLAGLFVFLIFYIGMVLLFGMLTVWCALTLAKYPVVKIVGLVLSGTFFLFLVKGFFKRPARNKEMHIEITEDEHPALFGFIHQICDELGAPEPNKVYVSPDVNAAVMPRTSLVNLFVEPKKDLLIGLGLVNCVNLSEFKAVLAHEFGHFSQSAMASSYTYVASSIIGDLVDGEDWFDRLINWCKRQDNVVAIFGHVIGGCLWFGRKILEWLYKAITLQRLAVSREREFHADLVAVSAAGSNAVVHCLLRTEFGHQCFMQALDDLHTALDHKLYSNDLYLHQDRAATIVRRKKKEAELGLPPALHDPTDGKNIKVFDPEEEELTDDIPPMWRTHPSNSDREANAKEQFVAAAVDHRSPWILFSDAADLKERMSYKFYRMVFRIPKNADMAEAGQVQVYIDNEHAETTYDPKYHGAYDDRPLEPGDLTELNGLIYESPWTEDRMEKVFAKLYDGCREHADAHADLHKDLASLHENVVGKPSPKMKRRIDDVEKKIDENWEWFKSFDRRVYLLHVQMAAMMNQEWKDELVERYRFQTEVQRFYQESRHNFNKANSYIEAYFAAARGQIQVPNDFGAEVIAVLRAAWKALKTIIKDAREVNLPAMKNFEEGERLADFILEGKMVPEPPLSELKGAWVQKLMTQLQGVKNRCFRLHFKSVGGILALQEKISAAWIAARVPVAAEVDELIAAEVVPAEFIPAEAIPMEPSDAIPAEVIPAVPVTHPEPSRMAAFMATPPLPAAHTLLPAPSPVAVPEPVSPTVVVPEPHLDRGEEVQSEEHPVPAVEEPRSEPATPSAPRAAAVEDDPFNSDLAFSAKPTEPPAPTPEPAPVPTQPVAEPEPAFSLDDDELFAVPATQPAEPGAAARQPVATVTEDPGAEIFSLDDDESVDVPPEIFTLDADAIAIPPATKPSAVSARPGAAPAAEEIFRLDEDDVVAAAPFQEAPHVAEVMPVAEVAPARPAPVPATPTLSPPFKPVPVKRPAVKITMVKPGEKSPFAR